MEHSGLLAGESRLTSAEVRQTVFPSALFGGVNADQVASFMRRVAGELDRLDDEKAALEEEIGRLQERANRTPTPPNGSPVPPPVELQSVYVLQRAQESADRLLQDAQAQAQHLVLGGRQQRERMMADGHAQHQRIIREAVDEAGREAGRIAAQAPIDAQRQFAFYQSMAASVRAGLTANLQSLAAQVQAWEEQERRNAPQLRRPATGPQPVPPPPVPAG